MLTRIKNLSAGTKRFIWIVVVWVVLDQWTKYFAVGGLTKAFKPVVGDPPGFFNRVWIWLSHRDPGRARAVEVVENFLHFRYVQNDGAAWGLLRDAPAWFRIPFFLVVSLAAMVFIVAYFRKTKLDQTMLRVALASVFGGALGNFLDRVRLGYVIDFIDCHWYDRFTWPTWNVADAGITVGVALLVLDMILHKPPEDEKSANKKGKPKKKTARSEPSG